MKSSQFAAFVGTAMVAGAVAWAEDTGASQQLNLHHVPVVTAIRGQPFPVAASVSTTNGTVESAEVFYTLHEGVKPVGTPLKMTAPGQFAGTIPLTFFATADSFRYYIEARGSLGGTNDTGWTPVKVQDPDLRQAQDAAAGGADNSGKTFWQRTGIGKTQLIVGGAVVGVGAVALAAGGGGGGGGGGFDPNNAVYVNASDAASGGFASGPQDHVVDGGGVVAGKQITGVRVTVNYQAYTIPDQFQIVYGGKVIADSKLVSGSGTIQGTAGGSSPHVTIRVLTPGSGTAWTWSAKVEYSVK